MEKDPTIQNFKMTESISVWKSHMTKTKLSSENLPTLNGDVIHH